MDCRDGHQWHDTTKGRMCAACLLEAPSGRIIADALSDPKRPPTKPPAD